MKKIFLIVSLFLITFSLFASPFWDSISNNQLEAGLEYSLELAESEPIYWLYSANIANLLGDYTMYEMYIFNYDIYSDQNYNILSSIETITDIYNSSYIYSFLGLVLWDEGYTAEAIPYLEEALTLNEDNAYALNYLSMSYYQTDKPLFLELALKAIESDPQYSQPYNNAAIAYLELGEAQQSAQILLDSILNLDRPHPNSYYNLVYLLNSTMNGIEYNYNGEEYLLKLDADGLVDIHNLFSNNLDLYFNLVDQILVLGDHDSTLNLLQMANEDLLDLDQDYFYSQLGYFFNNIEECKIRALSYSQSTNPKYKNLYLLGINLFNLNEVDAALTIFEKALEIADPADKLLIMRLHANLGSCYLQNEEYNRAISEMIIALEFNPYDTITLINIGRYYYENGDTDLGSGYLMRAKETTADERYLNFIDTILVN